jgi:predicted RNA binding protein YcfA (HicA-like mRNA interferase family)
MSDIYVRCWGMKPAELLRRLKRLASKRGWDIDVQDGSGHTKVWLEGRRTIISRHPVDLKTGTFQGILKQLGVSERDLND